MRLTLSRPGQSRSTFRCACRNSSSRPGFTLKRTELNAAMMPSRCGEGHHHSCGRTSAEVCSEDQDGDEQEADREGCSEQPQVFDDRLARALVAKARQA